MAKRVSMIFDDEASMASFTSFNSSRNVSLDESSMATSKRRRISTPAMVIRRLSGQLYSWGENGVGGQLGHGSNVNLRCKPKLIEGIAKKQVVAMVAGGMHTACVTADGQVYTFGCNDDKQLGRSGEKPGALKEEEEENGKDEEMKSDHESDDEDDEEERLMLPGLVLPQHLHKRQVVSVVAGDRYTAVATDGGQIYAWGTFMMELGGGPIGIVPKADAPRHQEIPALIEGIDEKIVKLTGGSQHLAMLSEKGHIWTMGVGFVGQLGRIHINSFDEQRLHEDAEHRERLRIDQLTPRKVTPRHTLSMGKGGHNRRLGYYVDVWSGGYCTVALAHKNCDVYGWGLNVSNQLGLEDGNDRYRPKKLEAISQGIRWRQIAFGLRHSLLLSDIGRVWAVGEEYYGRLGLGPDCGPQSVPKEIEGLEEVVDVSCGTYTSAAVTQSGQLYTWGKKGVELGQYSRGQLEDDDVGDVWVPTHVVSQQLDPKRVLSVALGGQHCLALATDQFASNGV